MKSSVQPLVQWNIYARPVAERENSLTRIEGILLKRLLFVVELLLAEPGDEA